MFFTSGISPVSLQSTDAKLLLCQMWTLTVTNWYSRCWILLQWNVHWRVDDCKFSLYILSSFYGNLACDKLCRFCPLPELAEASLLFAVPDPGGRRQYWWGAVSVPSNKGVWQQEDGETKPGLKAQSACVPSLCIILADLLLVNSVGGRAVGMGHIFLLLDIKEYDVGQYCGVSRLFTFTDAVFSSWFVNKLH